MICAEWLPGGDARVKRVMADAGLDAECAGLALLVRDGAEPVAAGALSERDGLRLIHWLAVVRGRRGEGLGDFTLRLLIRRAFDTGAEIQYVRAPLGLAGFFCKYGFRETGSPDAADAILMRREGDVSGACAAR